MNPEFDFEKRHRLFREIVETVILTLLMFLVIRFAVQNFNVDGTSMEPNLHNGELILVDKWTYLFHPPARGDVIVFIAPPDPTMDYVKRVIGLPGDVITISGPGGTVVTVDGVTLNENYVAAANQGNPFAFKHITNMVVPANDYFVLGDNRAVSSDSRNWGFVPRKNIIGRAAFIYWPLGQNNDGFLPSFSAVFANIHPTSSAAVTTPAGQSPGMPPYGDSLVLVSLLGLSLLFRHWQN
jgi:signal peptidase I